MIKLLSDLQGCHLEKEEYKKYWAKSGDPGSYDNGQIMKACTAVKGEVLPYMQKEELTATAGSWMSRTERKTKETVFMCLFADSPKLGETAFSKTKVKILT